MHGAGREALAGESPAAEAVAASRALAFCNPSLLVSRIGPCRYCHSNVPLSPWQGALIACCTGCVVQRDMLAGLASSVSSSRTGTQTRSRKASESNTDSHSARSTVFKAQAAQQPTSEPDDKAPQSQEQGCTGCASWPACLESGRLAKAARAISNRHALCMLSAVARALLRQWAATAPLQLSPEDNANSEHCASGLCAALSIITAEWGKRGG